MVNSATLVLFCRRPVFGVGKQRLAADLGARTALALSELLLQAALEDVRAWSDPVIIAPAGAEDVDWVNGLPNIDCEVISQTNGKLGERISAVDALARARGIPAFYIWAAMRQSSIKTISRPHAMHYNVSISFWDLLVTVGSH